MKPESGPMVYLTGAKRSKSPRRYTLIPPEAIIMLADRFTLGAAKYGDNNWQKGIPIEVIIDHLLEHIYSLLQNKPDEDTNSVEGHIGAILWAGAALAWYYTRPKQEEHSKDA